MFKIGEKIKIVKKDGWHVSPDMDHMLGKVFSILHKEIDGSYTLQGDELGFQFSGEGFKSMEKKEKPLHKFQVGDRVKVVRARVLNQYGGFAAGMQRYEEEGKIFTIKELQFHWAPRTGYQFQEDGEFSWDEECLRRVRKAPVADLKPVKPQEGQEAIIEAPMPVVEAPREVRTTLQVGDAVICVDPGPKLVEGRKHVITGVVGAFVRIDGRDEHFYPYRFKHDGVYYKGEPELVHAPKPKAKPKAIIKPALGVELRQKVGNNVGECSYAIEFNDGERVFQVADVCHARLRQMSDREITSVVLDVQGHILNNESQEYRAYIDYIINVSPWSSVFHRKGLHHAIKNGIYLDVNRPISNVLGAAVALREGSEFKWKLPLFNKIIEAGFSGNVAYLLSACCVPTKDGYYYGGFLNSHRVLDSRQDKEKLFAFFREGYKPSPDKYRTKHRVLGPIAEIIAPMSREKASVHSAFREWLKAEEQHGWDKKADVTWEMIVEVATKIEDLVN